MKMTKEVREIIVSMFFKNKRISKPEITKEQLHKYLMTIEAINQMDWTDTLFYGQPLEHLNVAKMFADFILPRTVTDEGDVYNQPCMLVKPEEEILPSEILTKREFVDATSEICNAYRLDVPTSIVSVKKEDATWSTVYKRQACDGCVMYSDTPFIPMELNRNPGYKKSRYNVDALDMLQDWCQRNFGDRNGK